MLGEGPWGMNIAYLFLVILNRNFLNFYKLIDDKNFDDNFLDSSECYKDMRGFLVLSRRFQLS